MEIKKLNLAIEPRLETGPVQFTYQNGEEDWPGFFIRGDNAFALRLAIAGLIVNPNDWLAKAQLRAFVQELDSCNLNSNLVKKMQEGDPQ